MTATQTHEAARHGHYTEFHCCTGRYRCTDIGTRVAVTIPLDKVTVTRFDPAAKAETSITLTRGEAEKNGWFSGPPYGVVEVVFDEDDLAGCRMESETAQGAGVVIQHDES